MQWSANKYENILGGTSSPGPRRGRKLLGEAALGRVPLSSPGRIGLRFSPLQNRDKRPVPLVDLL